MKKVILLFIFFYISTAVFTQNLFDKVIFKNGEEINCNIVRVNNKSLYYQIIVPPFEIKKIKLDELNKYEFNNSYFQTKSFGILEHSEIINFNGYSQDQIFRALKDWFFINSKKLFDGVYVEDNENFILYGSITTKDYWNLDFQSFMNLLEYVTNEGNTIIREYKLTYDVIIRVKNNRFKIVLNNFVISNNIDSYTKTLKNIFEKRYQTNKIETNAYIELKKLEELLKEQISTIENHCIYIADKDTFKESIIKYMLSNDNW